MNRKTEELEEIIGYHFKNKHYLTQALTHSSYANEKKLGKLGSNERLEFLGDAVLELISSDYLYARFTQIPEGELTKKRASLVCEPSLAYCAREFGLPQFLLLGKEALIIDRYLAIFLIIKLKLNSKEIRKIAAISNAGQRFVIRQSSITVTTTSR